MRLGCSALRRVQRCSLPRSLSSDATSLFDRDTSIRQVSPGIFAISAPSGVSDRWSINGNPNGGFTMSIMISAARQCTRFRDPLTCTGHYLMPVLEGEPATLEASAIRSGKRTETVSVSFMQRDVERVRFCGTFGDFAAQQDISDVTRSAVDYNDGPRPIDKMSHPDACTDKLWRALQQMQIGTLYADAVQFVVPDDSPFIKGLMSGNNQEEPRIDAHVSFQDGREPCLRSLALFNDCLPPAVLNWAGRAAWVPTIEYSVHFYARPKPGPLRASFRADTIRHGMSTINGEVQDSEGNVCSVSRQLSTIRV